MEYILNRRHNMMCRDGERPSAQYYIRLVTIILILSIITVFCVRFFDPTSFVLFNNKLPSSSIRSIQHDVACGSMPHDVSTSVCPRNLGNRTATHHPGIIDMLHQRNK